ncbi:MAG: hypothetical protein Q4C96_11185 [Planctomycetia bacterium]|nr:hypothetical protein [Planctomycetia bacterium]
MKKLIYGTIFSFLGFILTFSPGCRLCCAPYDYCGPVYEGGNCSNLMTNRCGSGVNGAACCGNACCGAQPVYSPSASPALVPTNKTPQNISPKNIPVAPNSPQVQYFTPTQQPNQLMTRRPSNLRTISNTHTSGPTASASAKIQNTSLLSQDGLMEVQVYDENGKFLGTEYMDAQGNTLNQVSFPADSENTPVSSKNSAQNIQVTFQAPHSASYAPAQLNYPKTPVLPASGGWKTRTRPR